MGMRGGRVTRRVRNRVFLLIGILLLVGAAVAQVLAERNPGGPPLSSRDSGGTGALAPRTPADTVRRTLAWYVEEGQLAPMRGLETPA